MRVTIRVMGLGDRGYRGRGGGYFLPMIGPSEKFGYWFMRVILGERIKTKEEQTLLGGLFASECFCIFR